MAAADAPPGHYSDTMDTVTDHGTGLTWQRRTYLDAGACAGDAACTLLATTCGTDATCTQAEAIDYCNNLVLGGASDFRLPKVKELLSLVDASRQTPCLNPVTFPDTVADWHWTSSTVGVQSAERWLVSFDSGASGRGAPTAQARVRCVRG